MYKFLKRYGFGGFAVLVIVTGLNDYQLKSKAERAYRPPLSNLLESKPVSKHLEELINILKEFYSKERFSNTKIKRLKEVLLSNLAQELWNSKPKEVAKDFIKI